MVLSTAVASCLSVPVLSQDVFQLKGAFDSSGKDLTDGNSVVHNFLAKGTRRLGMLDSDPDLCRDLDGRTCDWVDFSNPDVRISSSGHHFTSYGDETNSASNAVDGDRDTRWVSAYGSGRSRFWQAKFPDAKQFAMVELHSDFRSPVAFDILVDGIQCARMHYSGRAACGLMGKVVEVRLASDTSATMSIDEVRLAHTPLIRRIICPFIGTLVNEHVLKGCVHTKEKLLEVTLASGLDLGETLKHIDGNFKNNPSGTQDVCDMEGASNEHRTSTGINDCPTDFSDIENPFTPDKDCGAPNVNLFEKFFQHVDEDGDDYLTVSEMSTRGDSFQTNDENPIAEGTISGSFSFLIEIFGHAGDDGEKMIYRSELERILIERKFPNGYMFGRPTRCPWRVSPGFHGNALGLNKFTCQDTGGTISSAQKFCKANPECLGFDWRAQEPHNVCWYHGGSGQLGGGGSWNTDAYFLTCRVPSTTTTTTTTTNALSLGITQPFYIENRWNCEVAEGRCGQLLTFSGHSARLSTSQVYPNTDGGVSWRLVPTGEAMTFFIENRWGCPDESRCGKWLSWSDDNFVKLDAEKKVAWRFIPVESSQDTFTIHNMHCPTDSNCEFGLSFTGQSARLYSSGVPWRLHLV